MKVFVAIILLAFVVCQIEVGTSQEYGKPIPYSFGYSIVDEVQGRQHRQERGDGAGRVEGSYGFVDDRGIHRIVHYVADHLGFRAKIVTNEPGTANQNPAAVLMESSHK